MPFPHFTEIFLSSGCAAYVLSFIHLTSPGPEINDLPDKELHNVKLRRPSAIWITLFDGVTQGRSYREWQPFQKAALISSLYHQAEYLTLY